MTLLDIDMPAEVRRDRWGRYLVLPPEGDKLTGYQRATALSKMLEDTSNLTRWSARMTLLGAAQRPDIIASVLAADADDRKTLDKLAEQAKEHGGANVRRELGTAVHRFFELAHADPDYTVPEPYAADITAIRAAIDAAGFDVIHEYSERILVVDSIKVAGMCDMMLRRRSDGAVLIADLKTGSSVAYGALGWATQLSIYAAANNIYEQGRTSDGSDDRRLPMPHVDQGQALIIHCEPQSGRAELHTLTIGAEFVELAVAVREIRKRRDLLTQFEGGGTSSTSGTANVGGTGAVVGPVDDPTIAAAPVAGSGEAAGREAADGPGSVSTSPEPPTSHSDGPVHVGAAVTAIGHQIDTAWALSRCDAIREAGHLRTLNNNWPDDTPKPGAVRKDATWTAEQLEAVIGALDRTEARWEMPFDAERPSSVAARSADREADRPTQRTLAQPDDATGELADDNDVRVLRRLLAGYLADEEYEPRGRLVLNWAHEAFLQNRAFAMGDPDAATPSTTSERRYRICLAAVDCAIYLSDPSHDEPDAGVRLALAVATGEDLQPAWTTGAVLGSLTTEQAIRLSDIAATHRTSISEDGTPQLVADA